MPRPDLARTTAAQILDIAARLVQTRGFNGFSYADIAAEIGMTKATLHYHFPTKAELGRQLIERYELVFLGALQAIDDGAGSAAARLRRYVAVYEGVLQAGQMCMCGMLAAEYKTLPQPMQLALKHFFDGNERWLAGVLEKGSSAGELAFEGKPLEVARVLVGSLEGAMMLALSYGEPERFRSAGKRLLADLGQAPTASPRRRAPPPKVPAKAVRKAAKAATVTTSPRRPLAARR